MVSEVGISTKNTYTNNGKWVVKCKWSNSTGSGWSSKSDNRGHGCCWSRKNKNVGPRLGQPIMKQPTFNWEAEDKYNELKNFKLAVINIFKSYSTLQAEQIAIIKIWLGRKGLQFLETLTQAEQEKYNTTEGFFTILNSKFKPQYNETIKSLQFQMLVRHTKENAEEWIGRLRLAKK